MGEQTIGNDGLTDDERAVLADDYAKSAGSMTSAQVRATIARIKARRNELI